MAGIVVSAASLCVMVVLWLAKSVTAVLLDSAVLEADAACTLSCATLSIALLVSSLLRTLSNALWWVDGVAVIVIAALIGREGVHSVRAALRGGTGCGCEDSTSPAVRWLYPRLRTGNGDLRAVVDAASVVMTDDGMTRSGCRVRQWSDDVSAGVASGVVVQAVTSRLVAAGATDGTAQAYARVLCGVDGGDAAAVVTIDGVQAEAAATAAAAAAASAAVVSASGKRVGDTVAMAGPKARQAVGGDKGTGG